jgi:hypothetical protein
MTWAVCVPAWTLVIPFCMVALAAMIVYLWTRGP